jgi:hypothetical protein
MKPIPRTTDVPEIGSDLHEYIYHRQNDAHLNIPKFIKGGWWDPASLRQSNLDQATELQQALNQRDRPMPIGILWDGRGVWGHHILALGCEFADAATVIIKAYDPGQPNVTSILSGGARGFDHSLNPKRVAGFFVDAYYSPTWPLSFESTVARYQPDRTPVVESAADAVAATLSLLGGESDWRCCAQCQTLFYNGSGFIGHCPKGAPHWPIGGKVYRLARNGGSGEPGWKWCCNCQGLFWGGGGAGICAKGGGHDQSNGADYVLSYGSSNSPAREKGWHYCNDCRLLFRGVSGGRTGVCPANTAGHATQSNLDYCLSYEMDQT